MSVSRNRLNTSLNICQGSFCRFTNDRFAGFSDHLQGCLVNIHNTVLHIQHHHTIIHTLDQGITGDRHKIEQPVTRETNTKQIQVIGKSKGSQIQTGKWIKAGNIEDIDCPWATMPQLEQLQPVPATDELYAGTHGSAGSLQTRITHTNRQH